MKVNKDKKNEAKKVRSQDPSDSVPGKGGLGAFLKAIRKQYDFGPVLPSANIVGTTKVQ